MTEDKLVEACKRGQRQAQKEMYERFAGKMMAVCLRYTRNREEAEDILQIGFVKVFTKINSYNGIGSLEGWVRKVIVNTALESFRKKNVLNGASDVTEINQQGHVNWNPVEDEMNAKELIKIIQKLPDGFRTVFNLYAIEGYSHMEIAKQLNITEGTSKSQYSRAKEWLRKKLIKEHLVF
ncbi:MAG: sigma-70 family RNA polymerase sigma factor [Bacteroidia bacterium]|nr:sigma-70 family RNA polymerase sigma factor [Bacteroidia bacterium]NNC85938.1 sigma-70 family RNA polymerase sigma factor [Bacteroidia bacterium]NNM16051.1 sigma-70 family RNA polymerase sigma factor [Bacteroidia bacterium]